MIPQAWSFKFTFCWEFRSVSVGQSNEIDFCFYVGLYYFFSFIYILLLAFSFGCKPIVGGQSTIEGQCDE
jgi:hypothetical protein